MRGSRIFLPRWSMTKKAGIILMDAVKKMEERLRQLSQMKVRNIEQYNQQVKTLLAEKKVN